ncbi:hypothetical protein ACJ5XD_002016 [Pseudomonas aeruginosa]|uniref:hypothetical protein n=1 Tax=Pseudomonas aeruginosa TaxID=287 RepID=UPI0011B1DF59|nr:hypothetical protein [Pseudomonas aeruginosa]HCL2711215.1 hypothetical protein [Pseudomonas aeruginosa EF8E]EIU1333914.1 hypothetical protein [Pseudomonas aeruginosa]MBV5772191.1 hypothetical protein [Pseudomonas aeruginosa]MDC3802199.1 hypothetical protein [Pseudomonas aeruginosa]MED5002471.1 hypothetical protein [Pseudomonas aeruginosa]
MTIAENPAEESAADASNTPSSPSADHINDDHRKLGSWQSRWCKEARDEIRVDAWYVGAVFVSTLILLVLTWRGTTFQILSYDCTTCSQKTFNQYAFFFLGGVLGGTMFGIKYLYKVVARGYWNIDRRLWRLFSPFLSGGSALAIGGLLDSGMLGLSINSSSNPFYFSLGFISGYFADSALAKMQEIADTVFGSTNGRAQNPPKK